MESERLEAKFKKMKKKDIMKLRIALTVILPSLMESSDESASEISHKSRIESMSKMFHHPDEHSHSLFCKSTRRIVKKFKRINGMIADSIVDNEAWGKIMAKAID